MTACFRHRPALIHIAALLFLLLFCRLSLSAQTGEARFSVASEPYMLKAFRNAYPNVEFSSMYISALTDWLITMKYEGRTISLYWADGRFLPEDKLSKKDKYDSLLYVFPYSIPDPDTFTKEKNQEILDETAARSASYGTGTFFYDFIYDTKSRAHADMHIIKASFLGLPVNIHEKVRIPLMAVEGEIKRLAKSDEEVSAWVASLERADGFNWREIADSGNRSVHSLGIAVDILPVGWGRKNLYWQWRQDMVGKAWVTTPLSRRWLFPEKVIEIFERHGFVYGGKWKIWDNMHVEYKPELLEYRSLLE